MKDRPVFSVVVPMLDEEGNVAELHRRTVSVLEGLGKPFEIIFVNDGSTDGTEEKATELSPLTLISFRKRFGQTAGFDAGIKEASGEIIITMDGDLQDQPEEIPKLLEKLNEGYDCVAGWRRKRMDPLLKKLFSRVANKLRKVLLHDSIHDSGIGLKVYRREALKNLDLFGEMHRFIPGLLEFDGYRVSEVEVEHKPRLHGETKYNWKRAFKGFSDMLFIWFWRKYSARPMHFFGTTGIFLLVLGGLILLWMAYEKIFLGASLSERIWPLVGVFLSFIGIQFFFFGLLADIMVKNYYKMRGRMNYSIKEIRKLRRNKEEGDAKIHGG